MKKIFSILFISMLLVQFSMGQKLVLDAGDIPPELQHFRFIPDVEGKVLVEMASFEEMRIPGARSGVTIFPNWPVEKFGSNERGGVYGNMDNDPEMELIYSIGQKTYALNLDGTPVGGWPRTLDYPADGAPAYGDLDGDGFGEVVVTTHQTSTFTTGTVYAFEKNGANVQGFPVTMEGGPLRTPVLADLDGDGSDEIITAVRKWPEGFIHVYKGDGSMFPNFPVRMEYTPGSAAAVGDITGDEIPEIVVESYYTLHVFTTEGAILPGFPYSPGDNRVFSYSSPVLADLDGDGLREIICGDHSTSDGSGAVHIVRSDGTAYPGWPQYTSYWIYGPPSVGDIDGDGELDVAVGDQVISATPVNKVYAWTISTATALPGFPITNVNGVNSQIILADLDGDGQVELMTDDNTATNSWGQYSGYNHDGTPMEDWPLATQGTTFFINPLVVDINLNGVLDISGGGTDVGSGNTKIYLWNASVAYDADLAILPILQYNTRHNGVFGDYLMVGIDEDWGNGGLGDLDFGGFYLWPNPAGDMLTVGDQRSAVGSQQSAVSSRWSAVDLIILDLTGRILRTFSQVAAFPFKIDISELEAGVYVLNVRTETGHLSSERFVKISN